MAQVVSAITGTTAIGRLRSSGRSSCSTEAKYELRSRKSQRTRGSCGGTALGKAGTAYFRFSFTAFQLGKTHADEDAGLRVVGHLNPTKWAVGVVKTVYFCVCRS